MEKEILFENNQSQVPCLILGEYSLLSTPLYKKSLPTPSTSPSTPRFFFSQGTRHHLAHFLPKDLQGEKPWMCLPQLHLLRQPWLGAAVVAWEVPGRWMFVTESSDGRECIETKSQYLFTHPFFWKM